MGKNKRSQRTKGNTRPSSSGHSAELLSTTGLLPPTFIGFKSYPKDALGLKCMPFSISEDMDKGLADGSSRIIIKKMLKRDAVTKLKALQEFMDYCSEDVSDVKSILPFWPRLFNKLALDSDKRVREAIHKANQMLVAKVKRDIAPFLRSFMGTWLICQCDPYATAASAAQCAFSSAFPVPKQSEALMFCRAEIMELFQDSLFNLSADSFCEPNGLTADECEEKYQLVMTCTICGMKLFLSILSQDDKESVLEDMIAIVSNKMFWEYSRNKIPQIRGAWYSLISTLCQDMSVVFNDTKPKLLSSVMSSLSESDPIVAPAVWECALQVIVSFEDRWQHVNIHKTVLPELWTFLRHGGKGNAVSTFPCLLPFLSRLPKSITIKEGNFYKEFFTCIRESFFLERLKVSSECNAVVKAFVECIQYAAESIFCYPEYDASIAEHLITEQLIPLIRSSLKPEGSHVATSSFYPLLGQFLQYFETQAFNEKKSDKTIQYNNFLALFWKEMDMELETVLNTEHATHDEALSKLAYFFCCLHKPSQYLSQKKKKVQLCFESVNSDSDELDSISSSSQDTFPCEKTPVSFEHSLLFKYTVKICGRLCLKLQEKLYPCCIKLCSQIISAVSSSKLFFELLKVLEVPVKEIIGAPLTFFQVVLGWTKHVSFEGIALDSIADVVLCICSCVNLRSALHVLDICSKVQYQKLFSGLVIKKLQSKEDDHLFNHWFRTPLFGIALKIMTKRLATMLAVTQTKNDPSQITVYRKTLLKCISELSREKPRIPEKYIDAVLSSFVGFLKELLDRSATYEKLDAYAIVNLLSDLCEDLFIHTAKSWWFTELHFLMFNLFVLSVGHQKYDLPDKLQKRLCKIWKTSVHNSAHGEYEYKNKTKFLLSTSDFLHNLLLAPLTSEMQSHVVEHTLIFLTEIEGACDTKPEVPYGYSFTSIVENIFPYEFEWKQFHQGLQLSTVTAVLKGKLFYPIRCDDHFPLPPSRFPLMLTVAETTSNLLGKFLSIEREEKGKELVIKTVRDHFPHLLWSQCYAESLGFLKNQNQREYPVVSGLHKNFLDLVTLIQPYDILKKLVWDIMHLSLHDGMTWALPLNLMTEITNKYFNVGLNSSLPKLIQKKESNGSDKYMSMQVCLLNSPGFCRTEILNNISEDFFSTEHSSPCEESYFGVLAEVNCCLQNPEVYQQPGVQKKILCFLGDLINSHRTFESDGNQHLLFVINFTKIISSAISVAEMRNKLSPEMWDSILEILLTWFKECLKVGHKIVQNSSALTFIHQTCALIHFVSSVLEEEEEKDEDILRMKPIKLKWQQLFNDTVSEDLLKLFLQISESINNLNQLSVEIEILMVILTETVKHLSVDQILKTLLPFLFDTVCKDSDETSKNVNKMLYQLTPLLTCSSLPVQFGIHSVLNKIFAHLPKLLGSKNKADDSETEEKKVFKSFPLIKVIQETDVIVETVLSDVKIGDSCIIKPYSDSYTYVVAYLLAWAELLEYFSASASEERSVYASFLEDCRLLSSLLMKLIRLMPENPSLCFGKMDEVSMQNKCKYQSVFLGLPPLTFVDEPTFKHLQHIACSVYFSALKKVPALVRTWWTNLDKKTADVVEKFTSKYVSGLLSILEIQVVQEGDVRFSNMTIKARPSSREVLATYTLDDSAIELSIQLPSNYPLGPIVADSRRKMGVGQARWRNWLLQLTTFLNYHNGSIVDALALWKRNLDKMFEGVEECMICFYVLHSSSCKLPSISCSTCKKKFHSSCLYKWFNTSNNSTCPLCRNYF